MVAGSVYHTRKRSVASMGLYHCPLWRQTWLKRAVKRRHRQAADVSAGSFRFSFFLHRSLVLVWAGSPGLAFRTPRIAKQG